jgi:hypothetical protein
VARGSPRRPFSLDASSRNGSTLALDLADCYTDCNRIDNAEQVECLMRVLSCFQRQLLTLHFFDDIGWTAIARQFGLSRNWVNYEVAKAIRAMRQVNDCGGEE